AVRGADRAGIVAAVPRIDDDDLPPQRAARGVAICPEPDVGGRDPAGQPALRRDAVPFAFAPGDRHPVALVQMAFDPVVEPGPRPDPHRIAQHMAGARIAVRRFGLHLLPRGSDADAPPDHLWPGPRGFRHLAVAGPVLGIRFRTVAIARLRPAGGAFIRLRAD